MGDTERRRHRRFDLHHPATLRPRGHPVVHGFVENASLGGSLFQCQQPISPGTAVEVTLALQDPAQPAAITLSGHGKVVRLQEDSPSGFCIAVAYDEPLSQG